MKRSLLAIVGFFIAQTLSAQFNVGVFAGGANYLGELADQPYSRTKLAVGFTAGYEFSERLGLRAGLTFSKLEGGDKFGQEAFVKQIRNLSFQTALTEFSLLGEFNLFNLSSIRWTPYGFAGLAVYRFNPYVVDSSVKVFLQPLSTEGQGLAGSNTKPYKLTQFAIPFGGGLKYALSDNVRLGLEVGLRRLFTDYLDDVSTTYPDAAALLAEKGPRAVRFSYRGGEVPGETAEYPDFGFPNKGALRGGEKTKDWYYFTGLHLTIRLGGGYGSGIGSGRGKYGCPSVPL